MSEPEKQPTLDPEISAINTVVMAIRDLDESTQQNVMDYIARRFKLQAAPKMGASGSPAPSRELTVSSETNPQEIVPPVTEEKEDDALAGVSPVAKKWMSRNGLNIEGLSHLFSLGIDEIDLVAKDVPGKSKKERMKSVILLKAVAAYLGTGAPRVTHEQVKETCLHYDAWDGSNFAVNIKDFSADIGGTKESGYTLTARGLTDATDIVKSLVNPTSK